MNTPSSSPNSHPHGQKPSDKTDVQVENGAVAPSNGQDLRLSHQLTDALVAVPGGQKLAAYFGIGGGQPQQPPNEAAESAKLIDGLRSAKPGEDLSGLLRQITAHADSSGADPDALRALMRGARKKPD